MALREASDIAVVVIAVGLAPTRAWAAGSEEQQHFGPLLFGLALLVVAAKAGGLLAERWRQPAVLGELLVGIAVGNLLPLVAGPVPVVQDTTMRFLAEVGILLLLFEVGLDAALRALTRGGASALLVAVVGICVPIALGGAVAAWWFPGSHRLVHLFVGTTLAATSIGISARVLQDLGVARSREGQIILGAAILDDVLGLVILAAVSGMTAAAAGAGAGLTVLGVAGIVLRAALFLGMTIALGHFGAERITRLVERTGHPETMLIAGVALCFCMAFLAELVGLAGIVGAFAAGLLLDPYGQGVRSERHGQTLNELLRPLSTVLVPLFFVLMGTAVDLRALFEPSVLAFAAMLTLAAIAGKVASGLGVVTRGVRRLTVGMGMIPRGEVGLIFAGVGGRLVLDGRPLLSTDLFGAIVLMVLVTTLLTPIALRRATFGERLPPAHG
jgi:Kef-type K+ transport system membrane component KefB